MSPKRAGFTLIELLVVIAIIAILAAILFPIFSRARASARTARCQSNLKQIGAAITMYKEDWGGFMPSIDDGVYVPGMTTWCDYLRSYVKDRQVFFCPEHAPNPSWSAVQRVSEGWPPMIHWTSYAMNTFFSSAGQQGWTSAVNAMNIMIDLDTPFDPAKTVMVADASWNWFCWDGQDPTQTGYKNYEANVTPLDPGYDWCANMIEYRHPRHTVRDGKIVQPGGANFLMVDGHVKQMFYPVDFSYFDPTLGQRKNG
jgi:prepilin-type N-terminal cleavage/methylation domain-containing protein/prepilin-type processing-associated H-X9-DG protein